MTGYHGASRPVEGIGPDPRARTRSTTTRRPTGARRTTRRSAAGMPGGYAVDDGAALHFVGESLARVVTSRPGRPRLPRRRGRRRGGRAAAGGRLPRRAGRARRGGGACRLTAGARRAGRVPTIFAMGGGGFTMEPGNPALDDYVLTLAPAREPRICLLPTAGGDSEDQIRRFHATFGDQLCEPTHVSLFRLGTRPVPLREHLLAQDVIYVGGGSMVNLLALWRAHGLDAILREAWQAGIVLAGLSAGSMCWFEWGITKSAGAPGARARPRLPARLELRPLRRRAGAPPGLPRRVGGGRHPAGLGRRRRRRPAVPRHAARRGRRLAARRPRLPRARGRRRGRRGGDRAAPAGGPPARGPARRRSPSTSCARCARRGAGIGADRRAEVIARRGRRARPPAP